MPKICRVGRINGIHITCLSRVFLVRSRQSRSPFRWTRVTWVTKSLGSGEKRNRLPFCFLLDISLIFHLMWFFLHFTPSLHFTFSLQSALIFTPGPESAVRSPQSAVFLLHWPVFQYLVWQNVLILAHCILRLFAGMVSIENSHVLWFPRMKHNISQFC